MYVCKSIEYLNFISLRQLKKKKCRHAERHVREFFLNDERGNAIQAREVTSQMKCRFATTANVLGVPLGGARSVVAVTWLNNNADKGVDGFAVGVTTSPWKVDDVVRKVKGLLRGRRQISDGNRNSARMRRCAIRTCPHGSDGLVHVTSTTLATHGEQRCALVTILYNWRQRFVFPGRIVPHPECRGRDEITVKSFSPHSPHHTLTPTSLAWVNEWLIDAIAIDSCCQMSKWVIGLIFCCFK